MELIKTKADLCTGCNRCVRECPMETANINYQDEDGRIKVEIDHDKCVTCGRCFAVCKQNARYYTDDTERFFDDLAKGVPISLIAAPAIRTNMPDWERVFTYLKQLGVNKIYDVSMGADICIWGHIRHIEQSEFAPLLTQPCPAIVSYCEMYRHDLLEKLSPVQSPMACTCIYMKEYEGITDSIAALSPCVAKADEFSATELAQYNITFVKLREYLESNNIELPDECTGFDHEESGLGSLFPMPGGLKENIEFFMDKEISIDKAEGNDIFDTLNVYAESCEDSLPHVFDVLNCKEGCNIGTANSQKGNVFSISREMDNRRNAAVGNRGRDYFEQLYKKYDETFDLSLFLRKYKPSQVSIPQITEEDIEKAYILLGKTTAEMQTVDCSACGSDTCLGMARKVALGVNIPVNCIFKSKEDARIEHEENLLTHKQLADMEKVRETDELIRTLLDSNPFGANFWNKDLELIDINDATVKLFNVSNKKEYIENFDAFSPERQPDGRLSSEAAAQYLKNAFKKGSERFEWMHQTLAGEQIPCEITMSRVEYQGDYIVAAYIRDIGDHKRMMTDIDKKGQLLNVINRMAAVILAAINEEDFKETLVKGMELIGQCLEADQVQIWSNKMRGNTLHFILECKWMSEEGKKAKPISVGTAVPYPQRWKELFLRGDFVHGPVAKMSKADQDQLDGLGLTSTIVIPLFSQGKFWGIFSVDDCIKERYFSESEIDILNSVGLMLLNAVNRNTQAAEMRMQMAKLSLTVKATKIGLWDMEVVQGDPLNPKNEFIWSDEFRYMLGFENEYDFPNLTSSWSNRLHPLDKVKTLLAFKNHLLDTTGETPYDVEYRLKKKDGEYAYYHASGETIRDEHGVPLRVAGALMDVTETKNIILDTERQRIEAEAANHAKSAFLSTMSHEIRTPMNAILGITEILLQNETIDEDIRDGLEKIYTSGDMLLSIINDILDLSKIEAGKLELVISKYETASLISDTAQLNVMRIGSKPIEFDLYVDENIPVMLNGDELRIKQIMNNLLSNAFKYTDKGTVKMSVTSQEHEDDKITLIFSVSDTGQGMTKEQVNELFDEYSRFNLKTNRSTEGTGLGMSITRNLIHMMNGKIEIESEPGKGSVFTVSIPQVRAEPGVLGKEMVDNLHNFRTSSRAQMKRIQITRDPMPYGSVLIVDDVEMNIFVAKGLLAPYAIKTDSADSGYGAIEKVQNGNVYDIIFMDHMMPQLDGIETTKILRKMGYARPIVALTANAVAGQAEVFFGNGFDDFISKPIDIRQMNAVLNKLIRDKQSPEVVEEARERAGANKVKTASAVDKKPDEAVFGEIFVRDASKTIAVLDEFLEKGGSYSEEEIKLYVINTHGVKSALANIGKTELSATALRLEQLGRDNDIEAISAETPAFLESLRDYVSELTSREEQEDGDAADEDTAYLAEKLLVLKSACEEYDDSTVEETLKELRSKKWQQQTKELLDDISEKFLHSEFDEIIETITNATTE